jgi:hypothetical protein
MEIDLHTLITRAGQIVEIIMNLHVLALLIINTTRSPQRPPRPLSSNKGYAFDRRIYRLIELFAGLITPIAKK